MSELANHLIWTKREFWLAAARLRGHQGETDNFSLISSLVNEMIVLKVDSWKVEQLAMDLAQFLSLSEEDRELLGLLVGKLVNAAKRAEIDDMGDMVLL